MAGQPNVTMIEAIGTEPAKAVPISNTATNRVIYGRDGILAGWSLRATSSSVAATVELYDGLDATGSLVGEIYIPAKESNTQFYPVPGVAFKVGLYAAVTTGSVTGAVYVEG